MKDKIVGFMMLIAALNGCQPKNDQSYLSITPDAGTRFHLGDQVPVKVTIPASIKADSIVYLIDSVRITSRKDTLAAQVNTSAQKLGFKLITARVYSGGKPQEVSCNILLLAAKPPEKLGFVVEKVYPHDTSSYTEGLQYVDGYLYESTGLPGQSYLLKTDLTTGKRLQQVKLNKNDFGEGIAVVGNKIIQLTYKSATLGAPIPGYIYDKDTFKKLSTFNYTWGKEGWGMCFDGTTIYSDDSSNRITMLNKNTLQPTGYIDVFDDQHDIEMVNEMEYIDGKIYANIYTKDTIIVIDPKNGAVLQSVDLSKLYPIASRPANLRNNADEDVLNGIAWDEKGKRLFITGKKWDKLYQVKFRPL